MAEVIEIPYKPRNWAQVLHNSVKRWIVLVLHRRAGKTTAVLNHLQRDAVRVKKSKYAYIAPTYKQAKNIAWDILKEIARPIPGTKPNESELKMVYPNGSTIQLFGSENIDALRGLALWGGAQDEASQQPSNLFSEVISKALADHLGYWIWLGTPKGKNQFFRTYNVATKTEEYDSVFRTIDDSLENEQGEAIENLRQALEDDKKLVELGEMTQEEFDQEWYCSFTAAIKGAVYAKEFSKMVADGRTKVVPHDPALLVHTVWDLGKGPNMSIGFYQRTGNEVRMIDYWEGKESDGFPTAIKAVKDKLYVYGKHFGPHDLRATELSTEKTRLETAITLGLEFEIVPNIGIVEGLNAGKLMMNKLWVDEKNCELWLDAIPQYHRDWDEKKGVYRDIPVHDWCFTADTKVLTHNGMKPIIELLKDDKVLTKNGWQRQIGLRKTKLNANLVEIVFKDGTRVRCTPEHLFLTKKGWKSAKNLTQNIKIQSSLTVSRSILMVGYIGFSQMKSIMQGVVKNFIGLFGKSPLASYLADVIYTTRTVIQEIINLKILSVFPQKNIFRKRGNNLIAIEPLVIKQEKKQKSGINQRRVDYGIVEWLAEARIGRNGKENLENALTVKKSSSVLLEMVEILKNTVIQIVKPLAIESVTLLKEKEDVWDISVPNIEHFSLFNGAIVHNCSHPADVHRYASVVVDLMVNEKEVGKIEQPEYRAQSEFEGDIAWQENDLVNKEDLAKW